MWFFGVKIKIFCKDSNFFLKKVIFFEKKFAISKKSCNFAAAFGNMS